jgi:hypothetical protein
VSSGETQNNSSYVVSSVGSSLGAAADVDASSSMLSIRGRLNRGAGGGIKMKSSMVDGGVGLFWFVGGRCGLSLSPPSSISHSYSLFRYLVKSDALGF